MDPHKDIFNLESRDSLVRTSLNPNFNLASLIISPTNIPSGFVDRSFFPKPVLDLSGISNRIADTLNELGASKNYIKQIVPGVCEAVKNAYEHGNQHNPDKLITLAESISNKKVEFFVGDRGGIIDGNFSSYILLFRQGGHTPFYSDIDDFYTFRGDLFAPEGHSGAGTKVMHTCFPDIKYFKNMDDGLLVYLAKSFEKR